MHTSTYVIIVAVGHFTAASFGTTNVETLGLDLDCWSDSRTTGPPAIYIARCTVVPRSRWEEVPVSIYSGSEMDGEEVRSDDGWHLEDHFYLLLLFRVGLVDGGWGCCDRIELEIVSANKDLRFPLKRLIPWNFSLGTTDDSRNVKMQINTIFYEFLSSFRSSHDVWPLTDHPQNTRLFSDSKWSPIGFLPGRYHTPKTKT